MSVEKNRLTILGALECFKDPARREEYFDLYDPTVRLHGYAPQPFGFESLRQFYGNLWTAFPDAAVHCEQFIGEGDDLALRFHLTGTHQGPFLGVPATGKPIVLAGHTTMRFSAGKIVERWSTADFLGVLIQIGAMPAPEA